MPFEEKPDFNAMSVHCKFGDCIQGTDMSKSPQKTKSRSSKPVAPPVSVTTDFDEVIRLIEAARTRDFAAVNKELIDL